MIEKDSAAPTSELRKLQVNGFTYETLRARKESFINIGSLRVNAGKNQQILAIDLGGSKADASLITVNGDMQIHRKQEAGTKSRNGEGYRQFLEQMNKIAHEKSLPVGISTTGIVEGSRLIQSSYLQSLLKDMEDVNCDFSRIFPNIRLAVVNDAVAGSMSAYVEAIKNFPNIKYIAYLINGSGFGGAIVSNGQRYTLEPGHVEAINELNQYVRRSICSITGKETSCMHLIASGIGMEDTYFTKTGKRIQGEELALKAHNGDELAQNIYKLSSYMVAITIEGIMSAFKLDPLSSETVIVCHGGIFEIEKYKEMTRLNLSSNLTNSPHLLFAKDISPNACLDGAAISVLSSNQLSCAVGVGPVAGVDNNFVSNINK